MGESSRATLLRLVGSPGQITPTEEPREFSLRIFQPIFRYVRAELGVASVSSLLARAGIDERQLRRSSSWISGAQAERLLEWLRRHVDSDAEFMRASAYEIEKLYGVMALPMRLTTVRAAFGALARTAHLVTKVGRFELVASTRNSARLRYTSSLAESRLMCLSRLSQQRALPLVWWKASPTSVEEHTCIARGDAACEYTVRWHETFRMWGPLSGGLVGAAAAMGAVLAVDTLSPMLVFCVAVVVGVLSGTAFELRRLVQSHNRLATSMSAQAETMVTEHGRAVAEALALHDRERRWSAHLEETLAARRARLGEVLDQIAGSDQQAKLRSLSHDLNNPLMGLNTMLSAMNDEADRSQSDRLAVRAMLAATDHLHRLVEELSAISAADTEGDRDARDVVEIATLTNRIRRQLTVTLVSRDIRPSVFKTRDAPSSIVTDGLAVERVIDNLLTNTCKYTERGSIVVEVSGTPGFLLLKVSDTGRGIGPERLEQVFLGGAVDSDPVVGQSHGAGLSIVVGLLDHLGGRLEVMSKPGVGTTIWVYLPTEPSTEPSTEPESGDRDEGKTERFRRIVRIRPRR